MSTTVKNGDAIAVRQTAALTTPADMPPQVFELFQMALGKGTEGVGALRDLVELQDKMQRRNAELEFTNALARFQDTCPSVTKTKSANIASGGGGGFSYSYAPLEEIISTVRPHLSREGFSFTFDSTCTGPMLTCTCTLHHSHGHEMKASFTLPTESKSGATAQQKIGGANTYAKRQCLIDVLGLALADPEEASEVARKQAVQRITDEQRQNILALLDEVKVSSERFCKRFALESVAHLPANLYAEAVRLLEAKRKEVSL